MQNCPMIQLINDVTFACDSGCHPPLSLATHAFVPRFTFRCGGDVARADDEISKVLSVQSLQSVALDHRA
jgi:hypothetical protein